MYHQQNEQYMSQPVDAMSQSSYMRINKKFLEDLNTIHQIQDLSRYRQDSPSHSYNKEDHAINQSNDKESQNELLYSKLSNLSQQMVKKSLTIKQSPKHKPQQKQTLLFSSKKQPLQKHQNSISSSQNIQQSLKQLQSLPASKLFKSNLNNFINNSSKKQKIENTYDYYLLNKNKEKENNSNQDFSNQIKKKISYSTNRIIDDDQQEQHSTNINFSPKAQRFSNFNGNKSEIQRVNYRKLLEKQIVKNKQLQRHVYKLQSKLSQLNISYLQSMKYSKKLQKQVNNSQKIKKQNKNKMKQIDSKLQHLKSMCRNNKLQKIDSIQELKRQNRSLKEENQKYRIFAETLSESIFVLKGRKPKKIVDIWQEWKIIFQSFSKNKWKSPKSKNLSTNLSITKLK